MVDLEKRASPPADDAARRHKISQNFTLMLLTATVVQDTTIQNTVLPGITKVPPATGLLLKMRVYIDKYPPAREVTKDNLP